MTSFNKISLPDNFAQLILDNQIQLKLADTPPPQIICNLIELYSKGVEYYQSIKSYKYLYFKKKMAQIFTNDSFLQPPSQQQQSPITKKLKSKDDSQRIQALKFKQKQQKLQKQLSHKTKTQNTKRQAQKLIKSVQEKQKVFTNRIKNQLENQDRKLEEKLKMRKKRSFAKSFSAYGLTQGTTTKDSLFNQESFQLGPKTPNKSGQKQKGVIEPLVVNFQSVIHGQDSDEQPQMVILNTSSILPKGRMTSMGKLRQFP